MTAWAQKRLDELEGESLCGFIFKSRSPSSGMARVKLYDRNGVPSKKWSRALCPAVDGAFSAAAGRGRRPAYDPRLRENFWKRFLPFAPGARLLSAGYNPAALIDFHARHKLLLMSHSVELARTMGKLVAQAGSLPAAELFDGYQNLLMKAVRLPATPAKHVNVLQHILGYFKRQLTADEKQEMLELFEQYRQGVLPLSVPLALLNHYVRKYRPSYLAEQVYASAPCRAASAHRAVTSRENLGLKWPKSKPAHFPCFAGGHDSLKELLAALEEVGVVVAVKEVRRKREF
ncbi:MAG: DUF523 and DUF1722 domain-containing protein [Syntrophotaleaceae bacterium]